MIVKRTNAPGARSRGVCVWAHLTSVIAASRSRADRTSVMFPTGPCCDHPHVLVLAVWQHASVLRALPQVPLPPNAERKTGRTHRAPGLQLRGCLAFNPLRLMNLLCAGGLNPAFSMNRHAKLNTQVWRDFAAVGVVDMHAAKAGERGVAPAQITRGH